MANIDPAPSWADIRQLETTDRNMAGPGGVLNTQPNSIAARLNLLRDNATALNNTVAGVSSRQDAADSAIASLESQVIDAPGTLSDLDHGDPISVTGDQFPDVLSIDNSLGPVLALNESIADLAQRDEWLKERLDPLITAAGAKSLLYTSPGAGAIVQSVADRLDQYILVTDYGARGDSAAGDDSAAFQAAFNAAASLKKKVFIPPCPLYYIVGDVTIPRGLRIEGCASRPYTVPNGLADVTGIGGAVVRKAGASSIFKWNSFTSVVDVTFYGRDATVDLTQPAAGAGSLVWIEFMRCGIYGFKSGFGGDNSVGGAMVRGCNIAYNINGIANVVDSQITGCCINANTTGVFCGAGASDNSFDHNKVEWNNQDNWQFFQSTSNVVSGGVTDRAGRHNFNVGASADLIITGTKIKRGGRSGAGNNVYLESVARVVLDGCIISTGVDDGGGGTLTPNIGIQRSGSCTNVTITSCDLSNAGTTSPYSATGTVVQQLLKNCLGQKDLLLRPGEYEAGVTVSAGSTGAIPVPLPLAGANSVSTYSIDFQARTTLPRRYSLGLTFQVWREGGNASIGNVLVRYSDQNSGISGTEEMSASVSSITADGSSVTLSIKNNSSNTMGIRAALRTSVS